MDEDDEEEELEGPEVFVAIKIQALIRRFIVRTKLTKKLCERYEKIYDYKRQRHYYYDKDTDTSSWFKPALFLNADAIKIAPPFTEEAAANVIKYQFKRLAALRRIRILYASVIKEEKDEKTRATFYRNTITGKIFWSLNALPLFIDGELDHSFREKEEEDEDEDEDETESEESINSEAERYQLKMLRKFPRSKCQVVLDEAVDVMSEDPPNPKRGLILANYNSRYISSRLYDLTTLVTLDLSGNRLKELKPDVQFLVNLQRLDLRRNRIKKIPREVEELKKLMNFWLGFNQLAELPGNMYKLVKLEELDLSNNQFTPKCPTEVGNMELLKDLREWEVGIGR